MRGVMVLGLIALFVKVHFVLKLWGFVCFGFGKNSDLFHAFVRRRLRPSPIRGAGKQKVGKVK
jgi:hypothetical protein